MSPKNKSRNFPLDKRVWLGVVLLLVLGVLSLFLVPAIIAVCITVFYLSMHIAFFRDPCRKPKGEGVLSPADGKIVEISFCDETRFIQGPAVKIGIFLSIFDVHVNRLPWNGKLVWQEHIPGQFLDARDPECSKKNECNWMGFRDGARKFVVRQISGKIARHIHWDVQKDETLARGQKIGMICYGSRTELYLPVADFEATIRVGDVVKSAETVVGIWKK